MANTDAELEARNLREQGRARTGEVTLRDFDQGVVETLGAKIVKDNYFLDVPGVDPPPGSPGVPVTFAVPEDIFETYKLPVLLVRREDVSPAMQRWHPGLGEYRAPAAEAQPVEVHAPWGETLRGWDRYEQQVQAVPFDLTYTLQIEARYRSALKNQCNALLRHVLKVYPPYCRVLVLDSVNDVRSYDAFMEGVTVLDEAMDIAERKLGFAVTLRVEGELDLPDPWTTRAVTQPAILRTRKL